MQKKIIDAIYRAFDEVNPLLPEGGELKKVVDSPILSRLNSLGMVNLVVAVENQIKKEFQVEITLTDENAIIANPFQNVTTLVDYISRLIQ